MNKYQYKVLEVSETVWQDIMDSDIDDEANQHLNRYGREGWEIVCVVPKMVHGTTECIGIVFKRVIEE